MILNLILFCKLQSFSYSEVAEVFISSCEVDHWHNNICTESFTESLYFYYIGRSISLVFHLRCLFLSWTRKKASHKNANVERNPKAAATTSLPSRLPPNWTIHPDATKQVIAKMMQKTTSNIKTHPSLKVSYMWDTRNNSVNIENIKEAITTALKKVKAAPGAWSDVSMLHVIAITQDTWKQHYKIIIWNLM